jgi:hypothetical protein
VPGRAGRATVGGASLLLVAVLAPHVLDTINRLTGAGPVLWRLLEVVPVAALVGALAVAAMQYRARLSVAAGLMIPAAVLALLVLTGQPLWDSANGATLASRPSWKLDPVSLASARAVVTQAPQGSEIAAPPDVSGALAVITTLDHVVDPRSFYLVNFAHAEGFDTAARKTLDTFTGGAAVSEADLIVSLRALDVGVVCLPLGHGEGGAALAAAGYTTGFAAVEDQCFERPS